MNQQRARRFKSARERDEVRLFKHVKMTLVLSLPALEELQEA